MLNIQKDGKDSIESSLIYFTQLSPDLPPYITIIYSKQKFNMGIYYYLNSRLYSNFTSFSTHTLFLFQDPIQDLTLHLVTTSLLSLLQSVTVVQSLFFMT